jgi:type IV secretory pathway VirB2 component (pilin)
MKIKVFYRIVLIMLTIIMIISTINTVLAADNFELDGFEQTADSSIKTPVTDVVSAVLSVIRIVGTGVAIIIIAVIAMKYMLAAPGERADFKKGAIQYVIGAIIVFGASNILTILFGAIGRIAG